MTNITAVLIKLVPYRALPCEAQEFDINGVEAEKNDFGRSTDVSDTYRDEGGNIFYGCMNMQFVPHEEVPDEVLNKYGITEIEYRDIQKELAAKLSPGCCGWCE